MVLGKRKFSRSYGPRKRRRLLGRSRRAGIYRSMRSSKSADLFSFKRKALVDTVTVTNLSDVLKAYTFSLDKLPSYTEFTNLFDRYRICGVLVEFMPSVDSFEVGPGVSMTAFSLPQVRTIIDHTEDGAPLNFNDMYQYSKCKLTQGNRVHKRYLKPAVLTSAFESTVATAYIPKWKQWLTTDDPATPHYGLKVGINALPSSSSGSMYYRVYATYYFQCKDPK